MKHNIYGKNPVSPLRPPCRKAIYHSSAEVEDMIRHIKETRVTREIRPYKCDICGFWHMTSKNRNL